MTNIRRLILLYKIRMYYLFSYIIEASWNINHQFLVVDHTIQTLFIYSIYDTWEFF